MNHVQFIPHKVIFLLLQGIFSSFAHNTILGTFVICAPGGVSPSLSLYIHMYIYICIYIVFWQLNCAFRQTDSAHLS